MINALPPPEIVARLTAPHSSCVISLQHTDAESGDPTSAQCGNHRLVVANGFHGDNVRRISNCAIMLMIEGVDMPRLLHVSNCRGTLRVRQAGEIWTRQLLASARIAPSGLDRVLYYPIAHRPACYRIAIVFTPPGKPSDGPLAERSAIRCARLL